MGKGAEPGATAGWLTLRLDNPAVLTRQISEVFFPAKLPAKDGG